MSKRRLPWLTFALWGLTTYAFAQHVYERTHDAESAGFVVMAALMFPWLFIYRWFVGLVDQREPDAWVETERQRLLARAGFARALGAGRRAGARE